MPPKKFKKIKIKKEQRRGAIESSMSQDEAICTPSSKLAALRIKERQLSMASTAWNADLLLATSVLKLKEDGEFFHPSM